MGLQNSGGQQLQHSGHLDLIHLLACVCFFFFVEGSGLDFRMCGLWALVAWLIGLGWGLVLFFETGSFSK